MRVELVLLFLSLVTLGSCASTYTATSTVAPGRNYEEWRDFYWGIASGLGCAHIATYETAAQLTQIITAVDTLAGVNPYAIYLGAQKAPDSNTFVWAVGSRRGQPFFSANIISFTNTRNSYYDINFENGFICHQEYCFEPHKFDGYKMVYAAETDALILSYYENPNPDYYVYPSETTDLVYGVMEEESPIFLANARGGSKFNLMAPNSYFEAGRAANLAGTYLARIDSQLQLDWILDELQCLGASSNFWLGYEQDEISNNYVKSAGPSQGQIFFDFSSYTCVSDIFCNNFFPNIVGGKKRAPATDYIPRYLLPVSAVALNPASGDYETLTVGSSNPYIVQAEFCSINADQFFPGDFENSKQDTRICVPNPSANWASSVPSHQGLHGYLSDNSFFAGAAHDFSNLEVPDTVTKSLYFDCECKTDPQIDLACLGSEDFPGCTLYTNTFEYYYFGLYANRLMTGLNYSYERLLQYYYWAQLYGIVF